MVFLWFSYKHGVLILTHWSSTWILCSTETAASGTETAARQGLPQGDAPEEQGPSHGADGSSSPIYPIGSMYGIYADTRYHLPSIYPQCEHIYHTWILWVLQRTNAICML